MSGHQPPPTGAPVRLGGSTDASSGSRCCCAADSVIGRTAVEQFAGQAQVLTDDDAPVDQLLTPYSVSPFG
jgi:hypothetical protein